MIAVVDYGVGNLFSLTSSLRFIGAKAEVTSDPAVIARADGVILPGVGAFADARAKLRSSGAERAVLDTAGKGTPFLGICLGMQMLFDRSYEYGVHEGLGLIPGEVVPFRLPREMKVPHMGWNSLRILRPSPLLAYVGEGEYVYYVHSYYATGCAKYAVAVSDYGVPVTGAVARGNVYGTQFHPEKSGETGLNILRAFKDITEGRL